MRRFPTAALVVTLFGALPCAVQAQSVGADEGVTEALAVVETWLEAQQAYEHIPGLSAAVVHDQDVVWSWSVGPSYSRLTLRAG